MRVSSMGGRAVIRAVTHWGMQKAQAAKGRELITDHITGPPRPWWAVSWHRPTRAISLASANKDVTWLSVLPEPLGTSGGWLPPDWSPWAVDADQLQTWVVSLGELDPMSAFLQSLFAWAQCCANTVAYHAPLGWRASGSLWAQARQAFIHPLAVALSSLAFPKPELYYLAYLKGDPDENLKSKSIPLVTSRDKALLCLYSLSNKKRGSERCTPESANKWRYWKTHRDRTMNEGIFCNLYWEIHLRY